MFKNLLFLSLLHFVSIYGFSQCSTTNATGCLCKDNVQTNCDLLPDITISGWALLNYLNGPDEFPQSGAGADNGRLKLSGSTPNIGYGSFTVRGIDSLGQYHYVCGTDTFISGSIPLACPDGSDPKHLLHQRIYHKNGNQMTYWDRRAGAMTYHPTHGHNHVDDWAVFTLRLEDPNDPNPLNWQIVGEGAKIGFCLMDYGSCNYYNGHCRDSAGNVLLSGNFPNYQLGGGGYNCSPIEQGISSGYTDIYSENLDGMWINIPPNICNGDYWIIVEVDPHNYFLEENEDNNWTAVPFTLSQQTVPGNGFASIENSGPVISLCQGESVDLKSNVGFDYLWSTGATTRTISVNNSGYYYVTVTNYCGIATSDTVEVIVLPNPQAPVTTGDIICENNIATVSASGSGDINWYDSASGGLFLGTGNTYTTTPISTSVTLYAEDAVNTGFQSFYSTPNDSAFGGGGYLNTNQYLIFDAMQPFVLKSVKVYAQNAGTRTIGLRNASGNVLTDTTVAIPAGESRVDLNFNVPAGTNLRLQPSGTINLFRNNSGVNYPYEIQNVVSIHNSSAGTGYYYFYYDWEIELTGKTCVGPRSPANVTVNSLPVVSFSGLSSSYYVNDSPVILNGSPAGGIFSGPGITGTVFDPAAAGVGGPYTITYEYTDTNGCSNVFSQDVIIELFTGIAESVSENSLLVFPNPTEGKIELNYFSSYTGNVKIIVADIFGKTISESEILKTSKNLNHFIDLSDLSKGVYFIKLNIEAQEIIKKITLQ